MRTRRSLFLTAGPCAALLLFATPARADLSSIERPPPAARWYEWIDVSAFVDAYASFNYNLPKPQGGSNSLRTYDASNGFSLSWVGLDIGHDPDPIGAQLSLRFGPSAQVHGGACLSDDSALNPCDSELGLANVKTATVAWRPWDDFELRLGKFDAPFGAEKAESQDNINYTRGLTYGRAYPLFHTGLLATLELSQALDLRALLTNGWNNSVDNNIGKSLGVSARIRPNDRLQFRVGWLGGPEQDDVIRVPCAANSSYSPAAGGCAPDPAAVAAAVYPVDRGAANEPEAFRHLLDLTIELRPSERFYLVLGGDYVLENVKSRVRDDEGIDQQHLYGVLLGARYELSPVWAVAARGEYLADLDGLATGVPDGELVSATLTVDARLGELLLLRLENRGDFELEERAIFAEGARGAEPRQFTTTLGAVLEIE